MARMIGKCIRVGPGGLKCACCGNPGPGKGRKSIRRQTKRSERNLWRGSLRREN